MGSDVFFSYAQSDRPFARALAERLAQDGVNLAQVDPEAGEDCEESLISAIEGSDAVVLIISKEAVDSAWLMQELGMATVLAKRIVVVRPDAEPLPISFVSRVQVLDAGGLSPDQLAATVRQSLAA